MRARDIINEDEYKDFNWQTSPTYYNETGKHQKDFEFLHKLVPDSGPSKFLIGEIARAITRISYDYYNNGFGNNWTGAYYFLEEHTNLDPKVAAFLREYAGGKTIELENWSAAILEKMCNDAIEFAMAHDNPRTPNPNDMLDYSAPGDLFCQDCGEEVESLGGNGSCNECNTCGACGGNLEWGCECDEEDEEEEDPGDEW